MAAPSIPLVTKLRNSALFVLAGVTFFGLLLALGSFGYFGVPQVFQHTESGPLPMLFLDWRVILSVFDCHRLGVDVYSSNGCDPLGRPHVYPPLWLEMARSGLSQSDIYWSAPLLVIAYLAICGWQLGQSGRLAWFLAFLVIFSPAAAFAYERANIDLLMYLLVALVVGSYASRGAQAGWLGDLLLALAILLKIYPLALLPMVVLHARQAGWNLVALRLGLIMMVVLGYSWWQFDATAWVLRHAPMHMAPESFGARIINTIPGWNEPGWLANRAFHALIYLVLVGMIYPFIRRYHWEAIGSGIERGLLLAGTLVLAFCFFAGTSLDYRLVFVTMLVPFLAQLLREPHPRQIRGLTIFIMSMLVLACWLLWPLGHLVLRVPGQPIMILPETAQLTLSLWVGKQVAFAAALLPLGAIAASIIVKGIADRSSDAHRTL